MKRILKLMVWVMLLGLPVVMTSCDGLVTAISDNPISPGLKVTTPSIQVEKGKTFKCNAKASSRTNLVYASADPSIATVDSYGIITGVAEGKTTITITTEGKDSQAKSIFTIESVTIPVEVIKLDVPVKSVKLDKTELAATVGDAAVTLKATVAPDNATNKTVTWKSSNTDVATVDEDGVVTFVGGGTATITATATNGTTDAADDKTATCVVTVKCLVDKITLNKTLLTPTIGAAPETLTATVTPEDAANKNVTWKSSNTSVATVDATGKVTFVAVGSATITCTATNGTEETGDDKTATCEVTVYNLVNLAAQTANYTAQEYDILTGTLGANVKISIAAGATVTLKDANINGVDDSNYLWAGITCVGNATIILEGENTVKGFRKSYPGLIVAVGSTLTIKGDGELNASSNGSATGIGGGDTMNCGNIVIQGGTITATGGNNSAGIGGGFNGTCSTITISGGNVTAIGGQDAAGIGSGTWRGTCGTITISGGTVNATGGRQGAGIGGGNGSPDDPTGGYGACGDIIISDGTVEAIGGQDAAGIGGGCSGNCGDITISGGTVEAIGGQDAAGIGGGYGGLPQYNGLLGKCGNITISGGSGSATRSDDATYSIGKGYYSNCGTITINGAVVDNITTNPYTW